MRILVILLISKLLSNSKTIFFLQSDLISNKRDIEVNKKSHITLCCLSWFLVVHISRNSKYLQGNQWDKSGRQKCWDFALFQNMRASRKINYLFVEIWYLTNCMIRLSKHLEMTSKNENPRNSPKDPPTAPITSLVS